MISTVRLCTTVKIKASSFSGETALPLESIGPANWLKSVSIVYIWIKADVENKWYL